MHFKYEYAKVEVFWEGNKNSKKSFINSLIVYVMSKLREISSTFVVSSEYMNFILNQSYSILSIKQRKILWGWLNLKNNKSISNSWQLLHNSSLMEFQDRFTNLFRSFLTYAHSILKKILIHCVSGASMVMTVNFWWWKT